MRLPSPWGALPSCQNHVTTPFRPVVLALVGCDERAYDHAMGAPSLDVVDWRRRVATLYAQVRATSQPDAAHSTWVTGRDTLLRTHPASPVPVDARHDYPGAHIAPYDADYRFVVPLEPPSAPAHRDVATGTDGVVGFALAGRVTLPEIGELDVWWLTGYGGGLFLPIKDSTSGRLTYGGGRYVLDTAKGADLGGDERALVVDLNFAYQPSCAYDPAWACPLPGAGNTVKTPVPVGELASHDGAFTSP